MIMIEWVSVVHVSITLIEVAGYCTIVTECAIDWYTVCHDAKKRRVKSIGVIVNTALLWLNMVVILT